MINWIKSAEMNNCAIDELKAWVEKFPESTKLVWWICEGDCGTEKIKPFRFSHGMCRKCANNTPERRKAISDAAIKRYKDPKYRKRDTKEKDPLPYGQEITIPDNKNCSLYLGSIAEELLSKTFKNVIRMRHGNPGFDIICDKDFKIDIKSSTKRINKNKRSFWHFNINKNKIADYFLCVAFDNRYDLNPVHLWLIPGKLLNRLSALVISETNFDKWSKYEQSTDRVLLCCNKMKQPKGL